jgi:peptide/nickel transport system substrate-binding protein
VLLAACGGGGSGKSGNVAAAGGATKDTATAVKGGTLMFGYDRDFTKMDTVQSGWADPGYYAIYEFVVTRDPHGKIVNAMAESYDISADGLTHTIKIRDGLKFHSGVPCTAKDVVENFDIFRGPKTGQNAIFWPEMTVKAGEGNTVVIKLKKPDAALGETLATEYSMIENLKARKTAGGKYGATTEDGTGPFTLSDFSPGKQVVMNKWAEYPGSGIPFLQNKGPAYLDQIKFLPLLEPGTRANEIESGQVMVLSNPAPQDIDRLKGNPDLVVTEFPAPANSFFAPDWTHKELGFNDLRVRQALSQAMDRDAIAKAVFFGHAAATYGPIPPNYKWYEPGVEKFNQHNPDQANKLLDQAGWIKGSDGIREKAGQKLAWTHMDWGAQPQGKLIMEAIVPMFKDIGADMTVKTLPNAEFLAKYTKSTSFGYEWLWSGMVDVLVIFNAIPSPAANGDLPDMKAAFTAWQTAKDDAGLEAAARKVQLIWAEKLPKIPILTRNQVWVQKKGVHNFTPSQTMLYPFFNDVWIER